MNWSSSRIVRTFRALRQEHQQKLPIIVGILILFFLYFLSRLHESEVHVYRTEKIADFKDARILGSQGDSIYEGKERLLLKSLRELRDSQTALKESYDKLQSKVTEIELGRTGPSTVTASPVPDPSPMPGSGSGSKTPPPREILRIGPSPEEFPISHGGDIEKSAITPSSFHISKRHLSPSIISFPVKDIVSEKTEGIVLPSGSYVKAKLMTGVEAPEGRTYPALLQLDYAYVVPNHRKLDLSGCFMIAKSQGDLSTERVQMQATKLSCVSKEGRMFEREVNGFIADDKDNSFAVIGSVNSKQDRVAATAFLSSIVEGVGKAIQQAQTTQQVNPLGGSQTILTGNQMEYIGAGGAANAAGMVTSWYLKQAQNLLPTINVGSGQDIWVVMQDTVKLPNDYFRKPNGGTSESVYTYFSRIVD